jgi:hypothetical protein
MTANASSFSKKIDSPNSTGVLVSAAIPSETVASGFSSFSFQKTSSFPLQENVSTRSQ